ncbi:glycosyltransferase [uncultured Helicobacter sp.]|uniref:glycosyltransferase family 2 protein n=1 Tax=uncultured Helicobacter sp. TaxID=175537 RepID=UPI0027DB902D|nr:glycosyltransferase [uncultured Helicobacter sp.]
MIDVKINNAKKISICILVKNAQGTIKECLKALKDFDEIILLDNESTDSTLEIARGVSEEWTRDSRIVGNLEHEDSKDSKNSAKPAESANAIYSHAKPAKPATIRIFSSPFLGFGALKNLAISHARNEWVFVVDSDEVIEQGIYAELETLDLSCVRAIYALPRKNLYAGEWIKACGWSPDFVLRIFNKSYTHFNENLVHESVILPSDSKKHYLKTALKHYAYDDVAHLIDKMQYYSNLYAKQNLGKPSSPTKAFVRGTWSFVRNYFFKKGILYGYKGFIISVCNALGTFFKYIKLYELNTHTHTICSLIITTYNQKERLALVLDSVRALNPLPFEVIIADDGSKEDTRELIESYARDFPCALKHIWQEDKGFRLSEIRNKAINASKGEFIIVLDGDMIVDSHFVGDYLKVSRKGVFVQGSRVILDSNITKKILESKNYHLAFTKKPLKARRCKILSKFIFKRSVLKAKVFDKKELIKGVRGCSMGFFKEDFARIGGFSERFRSWGREDSEFVARFLFAGGEFRRLKFSAIAYHLYHDESPKTSLESNHQLYLETIKNKSKSCENLSEH